jgi:hypothetical protein
MTRGSAQPDRTTGPSHTNVVANSVEEIEAIKTSRRKQLNKFRARGTTDIVSFIPPEVVLRRSVLSEIKRDVTCQGDGHAPLPARGVCTRQRADWHLFATVPQGSGKVILAIETRYLEDALGSKTKFLWRSPTSDERQFQTRSPQLTRRSGTYFEMKEAAS